jgi:hypothetical protein
MENNLLEALEKCFKFSEEYKELEAWTDGGYNIILSVDEWTEEEIVKAVEDFDPCREIEMWWNDYSFRTDYNNSMREAQDDMEEWKRDTLKKLKASLHPVELETTSMYLTVRVDIRYPKSMGEEEAIETSYTNFDYDFKVPDWCGIEVFDTEICGVNE